MEKNLIITTSWDDGDKLDLKLVELLDKYNLKGTFYIKTTSSLSTEEIRKINKIHEVGAHTINHPRLIEVDRKIAEKEIIGSKEYLTKILGQSPKMFCYPFGSFNKEVKALVKEAGFLGARTIKAFSFIKPKDYFELETTLHVYPFPLRKKDANHFYLSRY